MGKFKDLFIKSEEQEEVIQEAKPVSAVPVRNVVQEPIVSQVPESKMGKNDSIVDQLFDYIIEKNLPGPDYLELRNNMQPLVKYIPDESQRIRAAYDTLKRDYPDLRKEKITTAISKYIAMIKVRVQEMIAESESGFKKAKSSADEESRALNQEIVNLEKQISKLQSELANKSSRVQVLSDTIVKSQEIRDTQVADIKSSSDYVINILQSDQEKIEQINLD